MARKRKSNLSRISAKARAMKIARQQESTYHAEQRRRKQAARQAEARARETSAQADVRRRKNAIRIAISRRRKHAQLMANKRASEIVDEKNVRRFAAAQRQAQQQICAVHLIDEYGAQIGTTTTTSATNVATTVTAISPGIQSVSKTITAQTTNTVMPTTTIQQQSQNTSLPNVTTTSNVASPTMMATQASPSIFYTETTSLKSAPRRRREGAMRQIPEKLNSIRVSSTTATGSLPTRRLPTLTHNLHLAAGSSPEISITETITTRSAVTISTVPKRMTRATTAAEVVVIVQNTEIKHENVDDDCVGSS